MARLTRTPRDENTRRYSHLRLEAAQAKVSGTAASHARSPSISLCASAEADAAARQLLAGSRASANTRAHSSAVRGASLLNAARREHLSSRPAAMARKAGDGKLKRPSKTVQQARADLPRPGNPYDIQVSPEKIAPQVPAQARPPRIKSLPKTRRAQEEALDAAQHPADERATSSPPPGTAASLTAPPQRQGPGKHGLKRKADAALDHEPPVKAQRNPQRQQATPSATTKPPLATATLVSVTIPPRPMPKEVANGADRLTRQSPVPVSTLGGTMEVSQEFSITGAETSTNTTPTYEEPAAGEDEDAGRRAPGLLDEVFEFLESDPRPGKCKTKLGTTLKRLCQDFCSSVRDSHDDGLNDINDSNSAIQDKLRQLNSQFSQSDQRAFKGDAYGYLFHALTEYLQAVYSRLATKFGVVTESLDTVRILCSLVQSMLACKDTIASWNISMPQRYRGERMIMEVDSNLIVPLRKVHKTFRVRLSRLEAAAVDEERQLIPQQELYDNAEQKVRRSDFETTRTERKNQWQILHIARMQCEPDPSRWERLRFNPIEYIEEKDSNGIKFERIPIFRARSKPPLHLATAMHEGQEWTDKEEIVLLEGLQTMAGMLAKQQKLEQVA